MSDTLPTGCNIPIWVGDNYCDDANNNEECEYDGGDCCGYEVNTMFCDYCECLDPAFNDTIATTITPTDNYTMPTTITPTGCLVPSWVDDNYCDDGNNNEECEWDGGDCCGYDVNTQFCNYCECLDPDFDGPIMTTTTIKPTGCSNYYYWAGDGYCDDITNDEECEWDGGDCCGENVNTDYCIECECLDPGFDDASTNDAEGSKYSA